MEKKSHTVREALEELRELSTHFDLQRPRPHRFEEYKVECLYKALINVRSAQNVLTQCCTNTHPWGFQQLYTALYSARLQHKKHKKKTSSRKYDTQTFSQQIPSIFGEKQRFYGVPRNKSSFSPNSTSYTVSLKDLSIKMR